MGKVRNWTKEEFEYLEDNWGKVSIPTIAKNLNRSIEGIKQKAFDLKLGAFLQSGDFITFNELTKAVTGRIASDSYQMISWVKNRGFPIHYRKANQCSFKIVYLKEFWEWAYENRKGRTEGMRIKWP